MRIHHLNGSTLCPSGHRLLLGDATSRLVCHCLLIETDASGLVLVDTALGLKDHHDPAHEGVRKGMAAMRPDWDPDKTMARQVEKLGFRREDVRHIVLTHLDLDHAGGLPDFPHARVHVYAQEHAAARDKRALRERMRYQDAQWAHGPDWKLYETSRGESWFDFECVRGLDGLPPEILLVPLAGHTRGHCAVAVDTGGRWLLHAGDAYFFHGEMEPEDRCPLALRGMQSFLHMKPAERLRNRERLRELVRTHSDRVKVFCAHDEREWRGLAGRMGE